MKFYFSILLVVFSFGAVGQDCPQATGLYIDNYAFNSYMATVEGHWDSMLGTGVKDFLVKYKHVDSLQWNNLSNLDSTSTSKVIGPLDYNTTYVWSVVAYCSEGSFQDAAEWAVVDTFTTLAYVDCPSPTNLSVNNVTVLQNDAFALGTWDSMLGTGVDHFIINYKLLTDTEWSNLSNMDSTVNSRYINNLSQNSYYEWRIQSYCSVNQSYFSNWSVLDTFYVGNFEPIAFSPDLELTISSLYCDSLVDLSISMEQDTNEPDIQSSIFVSNAGEFDISNMVIDQKIGTANATTGIDDYINNDYDLIVYDIITDNKATIGLLNLESNVYDSLFDIENMIDGGVLINVVGPSDLNSYTSGNSLDLFFEQVFINPAPTTLEFYIDISSELSDDFSTDFDFLIECDVNSIKQHTFDNGLYPNPAYKTVFFKTDGPITVQFIDIYGRILLDVQTTKNKIDVSELNQGMYFVYINNRFSQSLVIR